MNNQDNGLGILVAFIFIISIVLGIGLLGIITYGIIELYFLS